MNYQIYSLILSFHLYTNVLGQEYVNEAPTPNRTNRIEDVYLRFYNGSTTDFYVQFLLSQAANLFGVKGFQQNNPTIIYAHGFNEAPYKESVKAIASSYLDTKPGTNFVLIDWSNMSQGNYVTNAAPNTKPVGLAVAAQIDTLVDSGLPLNNIHMIGHSLGSHVAGYAARELKKTYYKTLARVTGIDPAFLEFYPNGLLLQHIRATDAKFVDIIHTDAGGYGAPYSTGTVDFWPNGGTSVQPGCPDVLPLSNKSYCSHGRSWKFYAESVRTPAAFPASSASSYLQFTLNPTPEVGMVYMGFSCPPSATGNFYLCTNSASPFGKGNAGLIGFL